MQNQSEFKTHCFSCTFQHGSTEEETAKRNEPNIMTHCYPNITCLHQEPLRRKAHFGKGINIIITKNMEKLLCLS